MLSPPPPGYNVLLCQSTAFRILQSALPQCTPVRLCGLRFRSVCAHFEQASLISACVCVCICVEGRGGGQECRRKVLDVMCSKMSVSTSVMLECAQSVPVWDRWLALLPKVLLLFCILYLLLIRQTACTVCILLVCLCVGMGACMWNFTTCVFVLSCAVPCTCTQDNVIFHFCYMCGNTVMHRFCTMYGTPRFCSMLSWEVENGKCSGVKALLRWIHQRGDTQTPAAKWCRSSVCLQAVSLVQTHHSHRNTHTQTLWEPLTGPSQRLKAVISSLEALARWCWP